MKNILNLQKNYGVINEYHSDLLKDDEIIIKRKIKNNFSYFLYDIIYRINRHDNTIEYGYLENLIKISSILEKFFYQDKYWDFYNFLRFQNEYFYRDYEDEYTCKSYLIILELLNENLIRNEKNKDIIEIFVNNQTIILNKIYKENKELEIRQKIKEIKASLNYAL